MLFVSVRSSSQLPSRVMRWASARVAWLRLSACSAMWRAVMSREIHMTFFFSPSRLFSRAVRPSKNRSPAATGRRYSRVWDFSVRMVSRTTSRNKSAYSGGITSCMVRPSILDESA